MRPGRLSGCQCVGAAGAGKEMNSFSGAGGGGVGGAYDGGGFRRCGAAAVILRLKTLFLPPSAVLEAVKIKKPSVQIHDDVCFRGMFL